MKIKKRASKLDKRKYIYKRAKELMIEFMIEIIPETDIIRKEIEIPYDVQLPNIPIIIK